ncbi:hypothetical protein DOTSEDRAFT_138522 [Dothistroma septosporum NZE10]|uniref:N-acetyltransferase domain-containing protein n=1 Tax=Dothistroma septosporum (strain NZE10 / CBS 128990) TaxID=675120 RepID=M2YJS5_DOTSN|nr:hypothetical protein DOTSEDRAFT_138522 [Dothistroma septosporum NZE10]
MRDNTIANPPLTYRLATPSDAPHLAALINTVFRSEPTGQTWLFSDQDRRLDIVSTDLVTSFITSPDSVVLTGTLQTTDPPVSISCCYLRAPSTPPDPHISEGAAWLGLLSVSLRHHKQGYGLAMLRAAEEFVKEEWAARRLEFDVVSSRVGLRAWYGRCGYEGTGARREFRYGERGREVLAEGLELVVMGRELEGGVRKG